VFGHHPSFYWATEQTKKWVSGSSSVLATMKTCCSFNAGAFVFPLIHSTTFVNPVFCLYFAAAKMLHYIKV